MATFIRFMRGETLEQATANAQADLERGYSFRGYQFYPTQEAAAESDFVQYLGVDAESIVKTDTGAYGFALDGLCGYEDDDRDLRDYPYSETFDFVARYEGSYAGEADAGDGDLFRPARLIGVELVAAEVR